MKEREKLGSRLGFILLSAGCAIGLGNVWRFPFLVGNYGGGAFVLMYVIFLVILGVPVMTMEFAVGRASQRSVAMSFQKLQPPGKKWHLFGWVGMAGNYLLMMFYTTIAGWMLAYLFSMASGQLSGLTPEEVGGHFGNMVSSPVSTVGWMVATIVLAFGVIALGLQAGVEKITKLMMSSLFVIMIIIVIRAITLPGAGEGLKFYLIPNFSKIAQQGLFATIMAAMGQAFFSLSLGMGSMQIFGSYLSKERALVGEARNVVLLDTCAAIMSGLIIFPACFAFGVNPGAGPPLVFITLPNIFNNMPGGYFWGILFFIFMVFAALSTVIAVFENICAFAMDLGGWSRKKAVVVNLIAIPLLSLPAALGFNLWSGVQPFGEGSGILDLLDFIVGNNILPLGALIYVLFCVTKIGWGWDKFIAEADTGKGIKFPKVLRGYLTYVLPAIILIIFIVKYLEFFKVI